eukprot:TRINITY_DN29_c1_g1_i10.p1 TRINITY_DN29_c1_g1~~TRINITY_DN29_c1_g1_i10.p1  ORF type:complete len:382 (+),score=188.70 TRINITY_DN29_c1_g1_i10:116-1261(+)
MAYFWRASVWAINGYRSYGKAGFERASTHWNIQDLNVDIQNKSFMITGANSGIGKEVAREIAIKGGSVHMICRNRERGEAAKNEIINQSKNERVYLHIVDIGRPTSIKEFAKQFIESGQNLDVLVNNAGFLPDKLQLTEDGIEETFATNSLGTFLLTNLLIPVLKKTAQQKGQFARVISVTSGGALTQKMNVDDFQFSKMKPFDGPSAYSQTKRAQIILTQLWTIKFPPSIYNINFYCMHPGWADTPGVEKSLPSFYNSMKDKLRSAAQGADTIIWLSITNNSILNNNSGKFFEDRTIIAEHLPLCFTQSSSKDNEKLWDYCCQLSNWSPNEINLINPTNTIITNTNTTTTTNTNTITNRNINESENTNTINTTTNTTATL